MNDSLQSKIKPRNFVFFRQPVLGYHSGKAVDPDEFFVDDKNADCFRS